MKKISINSTVLVLIQAVFYVAVLNMTLLRHVMQGLSEQESGLFFLVSIPFVLTTFLFILLLPFSIKFFEKPFYILLIVTSAIVNYTMFHYGLIFDPDMIENFAATNYAEGSAYFNMSAVLWVGLTGILPAVLIFFTKITHYPLLKDIGQKLLALLIAVALIGVLSIFIYKDYAAFIRNNSTLRKQAVPYYYVVSTVKYLKRAYFTAPQVYREKGLDAKMTEGKERPDLVVVMVGETARAQNYQLGGYERATNRYTKDIPNLVYFENTTSCGTATAVSLPCMFSMRNRKEYSGSDFKYEDNLTDIVKRAGVQSLWIDNNTGSKGVSRNIRTMKSDKDNKEFCNGVDCTDDILLDTLRKELDNIEAKDTVIYMHIIGSHGPAYFERYPESHTVFKPACERSDIQNCSDEDIRNSFDNTILFTDYVMAGVIKELKDHKEKFDTAMIYMSDHGESLGESGIYLHGMPYAVAPVQQTHVPFIAWFADDEIKEHGLDMDCLKKAAKEKSFSHDNLAHTLLGLLFIKTSAYDESLDAFKSCKKAHGR